MLPNVCVSTVNLASTDVYRLLFKEIYENVSCVIADNCPRLISDLDMQRTSFPNAKLLRISGTAVRTVSSGRLESLFVNGNRGFYFTPLPTLRCLSVVDCFEQIQLFDLYQNYPSLERLFVDARCKLLGVNSRQLEVIRVGEGQTYNLEQNKAQDAYRKYEALIEQLIMIYNE